MAKHELRAPEDEKVFGTMKQGDELTYPTDGTTNQVVSFSFPLGFDNYQFDYGDLGKTTCIWIDHGPNELPQLQNLHD